MLANWSLSLAFRLESIYTRLVIAPYMKKLIPVYQAVAVSIVRLQRLSHLFFCDIALAKVNKDLLELLLVHGAVLVQVVGLEHLYQLCGE